MNAAATAALIISGEVLAMVSVYYLLRGRYRRSRITAGPLEGCVRGEEIGIDLRGTEYSARIERTYVDRSGAIAPLLGTPLSDSLLTYEEFEQLAGLFDGSSVVVLDEWRKKQVTVTS